MWTTLKKSIMSKIGGFDGTRRWKYIITGVSCRRYSFNRWYTRIHNNFLDNFLNSIIAILSQYSLIMQILFFAFLSGNGNWKNVKDWTPIYLDTYVHFFLYPLCIFKPLCIIFMYYVLYFLPLCIFKPQI